VAGVGGVVCDFVRGGVAGLKQRVEVWQRPGIDGYGAMALGLGDSSFFFTLVVFDTIANVEAWILLVEALQGSVISVVDDWGVNHSSLLVEEVSEPRRSVALGNGGARGELKIRGRKVA